MELAETILAIGLFKKLHDFEWYRELPEEGTTVNANLITDHLTLTISPAVSTFMGHLNKRHAAGVVFEIAAKYAERVQGTIIEHANVVGCKPSLEVSERLLAVYPDTHLDFLQLCPGWQATFMGEGEGNA